MSCVPIPLFFSTIKFHVLIVNIPTLMSILLMQIPKAVVPSCPVSSKVKSIERPISFFSQRVECIQKTIFLFDYILIYVYTCSKWQATCLLILGTTSGWATPGAAITPSPTYPWISSHSHTGTSG